MRLYFYNNKKINKSECFGLLHKARKTLDEECIICDKRITKGQYYIVYNQIEPYYWHKKCLEKESENAMIGIKIKKGIYKGLENTPIVICKKLSELRTKTSRSK